MKTAISIRDDIFEAAERMAATFGVSRSELYARAIAEFVEQYSGDRVTERLNEVYGDDGSSLGLDEALAALQFHSLPVEGEW